MLVLSRKVGESIVIDGDVVVSVLESSGNRVSLGIQAPREKTIYRMEIHAAMTQSEEEVCDRRSLCAVS